MRAALPCVGWIVVWSLIVAHRLAATGYCSEPTTLREHQKPVADVEFSADGTLLASISTDGETIVWDLKSGTAQRAPSLPRDLSVGVPYVRFTIEAAPQLLAGCSTHGLVIDPRTLQSVSEWGDRARLNADGLVYAGGRRIVARTAVKEANRAEALYSTVDSRDPLLLAVSADGNRLFTNYLIPHGNNAQMQVLEAATGRVQCDLKAFTGAVKGVGWVDAQRVVTLVDGGSYGGSLMLWDVSGAGKLLSKIDVPGAWRLTVSGDGRVAAVALRENKMALVDIGEKQLQQTRTMNAGLWGDKDPSFSLSHDGSRVLAATASDSRWQLLVCDARSGAELLVHQRQHTDTLPELSPDGRWVAVGHANGTISLLPVDSGAAGGGGGPLTELLDLPLEQPQAPGIQEGIRNAFRRFSDGRVEVSRSGDVFVLNPSQFLTGRVSIAQSGAGGHHWPVWEQGTSRPEAPELPTWSLLPDGTCWVEGRWVGNDLRPKFFSGKVDPVTGQYQLQRQSRSDQYLAMQPSPDGTLMAVRAAEWTVEGNRRKELSARLVLLDLKSGQPVRNLATDLSKGPPCRLVFSSSGQKLAVLENWKLRLFDTATGDELPLVGEWRPTHFWFVEQDKVLVRQHSDGSIIGVDLETQAETFRWQPSQGQTGQATAVELSADGRLAAVGGRNGDLTLRNPRTGEVLHRLQPFDRPIGGLGFSADGAVLAAADEERRLIAWKIGSFDAPPADEAAALREIRVPAKVAN